MHANESKGLGVFRNGSLWLLTAVVACAAQGISEEVLGLTRDWEAAAFGVGIGGTLLGLLSCQQRGFAPFDRRPEEAATTSLGPIAIGGLATALGLQFVANGDASPIPHLPVLNPIDLTVWLLAVAALGWWKQARPILETSLDTRTRQAAMLALVALAFACLNGLLVRAVHQWGGVALDMDALWESTEMQVTLSIAWTLVGLAGMLISNRTRSRPLWMGCATLLGMVVVKLFTVDLSQLSTVARIATFLVVGVLLLVLGFFSPVPPVREVSETIEEGSLPQKEIG
jgi:uncharacterized membrane protein